MKDPLHAAILAHTSTNNPSHCECEINFFIKKIELAS